MNRRTIIAAGAAALAGAMDNAAGEAAEPRRTEVLAYYFPQFHPDPRNDAWHGKGWTEWELVKAARPRFPGHRQPIVPEWGYFDEADPAWTAKEIDLAADHGLTGFLYDWYWYEDGPFLQAGLESGFLKAPNRQRLKFAVMWANHDWLNIHPVGYRNRPESLASGRVSRAALDRLTGHVVERYFSQPNHLRIDGAPYFSIYELGTFVAGLGGVAQAREALDAFRAKVRAAGHPGLHLNAVVWGVQVLPSELKVDDPVALARDLGLASVGSYTWIHHFDPNGPDFPHSSYGRAAERNYAVWEENAARFPMPYHPNVTMGWDSSPRTIQSDSYESRGYPFMAVLEGNTPAAFREALKKAKAFVEKPGRQRIVTLNAWNEWTEGSYLLPDRERGTAYLRALREVFPPAGPLARPSAR
jgi:hypothetical protein